MFGSRLKTLYAVRYAGRKTASAACEGGAEITFSRPQSSQKRPKGLFATTSGGVILVLALCLAAALPLAPASRALAAPSEARAALESTINQILAEIRKPDLKDPARREAVLAKVENTVRGLFSFEELSMRTVGPAWKNFSNDQKRRFIAAFEDLLRERYLASLDGYNGESVTYTGEVANSKGDRVEIQTSVNFKDKPALVAYRMMKKDRWMVYDVIIEGVSLVQNYRTQFQDLLAKGDAEALIKAVRAKADETRTLKNKEQA